MNTRRVLGLAGLAASWSIAGPKLLPWVAPSLMPQPDWTGRPIAYTPANRAPRSNAPIAHEGWSLRPLADVAHRGRIIATERYRFDSIAGLCPWDIAIAWGGMSDPAFLRKLVLWQGDRFLMARWSTPGISFDELSRSFKNIHTIPADEEVLERVRNLRPNDVVRMSGTLVDCIREKDGFRVTSSTRYDDTGAGACQVCLLRSIVVEQA